MSLNSDLAIERQDYADKQDRMALADDPRLAPRVVIGTPAEQAEIRRLIFSGDIYRKDDMPSLNQRLMPVFRRNDVWWINAALATPDRPEWGEYATKAEAVEARDSYLRNNATGRELVKCNKPS